MIDLTTRLGRHATRRFREENIIWLTTVDSSNSPQPRPVWFHWDGSTFLIFSQPDKAKLRHIARNAKVSLSLNTDEEGGDVVVLHGEAVVSTDPPPAKRVKEYLRKYGQGIADLGMTVEQFREDYNVAVIVTPQSIRGFF
jgi:PPOX class probable F420-dependent enzyme